MGRVWKGRMCWATTRVARRVEGRGFSICKVLVAGRLNVVSEHVGLLEDGRTAPCFGVLQGALLGLLFGSLSWHRHVCLEV